MDRFTRECGTALIIGGVLLIVLNAVVTPLMPNDADEATLRTSGPYLVRLSLAVIAAMAYVLGSIGVRLALADRAGVFDKLSFWIAFVGNCLLVGLEWSNVFVLRPVAQVGPEILEKLDSALLLNIGFGSGASLFALGWILMSISVWRQKLGPVWAPALILGGLVLAAILGATPLGIYGMIIGSVVMGLGLIGLGNAVRNN